MISLLVDTPPSSLAAGSGGRGRPYHHSRRKFFVLADIAANAKRGKNAAPISPMALEAVKRIDTLFDIEREINGLTADQRLEGRHKESLSLVNDLQAWLQTERLKLSRSSPVAEAIDYMLKRWDGFTSFLEMAGFA
jgi:transposase